MGQSGGCAYCRPARTRRRKRGGGSRDDPVQWCDRCRAHVCARHVTWENESWLCTRCSRGGGDVEC